MVNLVLVQANRLHKVNLDFVAGRDAANEIVAGRAHVLGHSQDGRDIVAGVRILGGQEGVVVVELAHGNAVGPSCPFGRNTRVLTLTEHVCTVTTRGSGVGQRL